MRTRVIVSLVGATSTTATQIRTAINSALTGKAQFSDVREPNAPPVTSVGTDGVRRTLASLRFQSPTDAAAFYNAATTEFNRSRVLAGSRMSMHNCCHDNPEAEWFACDSSQAAYQELVK